ncbi:capping complex subunit for YIEGIA [Effusibacillus consociatus]|uniref:Uncharacterized protein n=1 Tax=Effusibacillus consociatus TaxID=1117041 RepID=A0ABV9Q5V3_9BACL
MRRDATNPNYQILSIVTPDESIVKNGKATMFICKDEQEQEILVKEVANALRGDVARLSNGVYLVVRA